MPVHTLWFRASCGLFLTTFIQFMAKRVQYALCMRFRRITVRNKLDVVIFVFVASYLLCCGDIESNPGPVDNTDANEMERPTQRVTANEEDTSTTTKTGNYEFYDKDIKQMLTEMFEQQQEKIHAGFESLKLQLTSVQEALNGLTTDIVELRARVTCLEDDFCGVREECQETTSVVTDMEGRMQGYIKVVDDKIDKLEAFSRRDNLKFFGIPESENETFSACAQKVVDILQGTVTNKVWSVSDIVRAHRLGPRQYDCTSKPRPMIAKFLRWSDKMDVLEQGRPKLREMGVKIAGDLTTRQQQVLKDHRSQGLYAYYRGDRLIVEGPTRHHDNAEQHAREPAAKDNPHSTDSHTHQTGGTPSSTQRPAKSFAAAVGQSTVNASDRLDDVITHSSSGTPTTDYVRVAGSCNGRVSSSPRATDSLRKDTSSTRPRTVSPSPQPAPQPGGRQPVTSVRTTGRPSGLAQNSVHPHITPNQGTSRRQTRLTETVTSGPTLRHSINLTRVPII